MEASAEAEVPMIRDVLGRIKSMLSVEHIPVVANLRWESLESLLRLLCEQVHAQGEQLHDQSVRLKNAEERGKNFEAELNLCKTAVDGIQADKQQQQDMFKHLEEQQALSKLLEDKLGNVEAGLDAHSQSLKNLEEQAAALRNDLSALQSLPPRVDALEENLGKVTTATANLQQAFRNVDIAKFARRGSGSGRASLDEMGTQLAEGTSVAASLEALSALGEASGMESSDRFQYLEAQIEQLRDVLQQVSKAHTLDLDGLRKAHKNLRQDFEVKSLMSLSDEADEEDEEESTSQGVPSSKLEAAVAELQRHVLRKADTESVSYLESDVQGLKESIEQLGGTITALRSRKTVATTRSSLTRDPTLEVLEARMQKAEDELVTLAAGKADRSLLDELQMKISLLSPRNSSPRDSSPRSSSPRGSSPRGSPVAVAAEPEVADVAQLQGLTEMISKKADRSELVDLRLLFQNQLSKVSSDDLRRVNVDIEELQQSLRELAERSDLTVLLAKRATQIADPVASVVSVDDDELRDAINDHARRLAEQRDMLLQLEALAENKADQSTYMSLKTLIEGLQKGRKTRGMSLAPELSVAQIARETTMLQQMLTEVTESIQEHDRVLQQLTKSVLIMSGHDETFLKTTADEEIDSDGIVSVSQPEPEIMLSEGGNAGLGISRPNTPSPNAFPQDDAALDDSRQASSRETSDSEASPKHGLEGRSQLQTSEKKLSPRAEEGSSSRKQTVRAENLVEPTEKPSNRPSSRPERRPSIRDSPRRQSVSEQSPRRQSISEQSPRRQSVRTSDSPSEQSPRVRISSSPPEQSPRRQSVRNAGSPPEQSPRRQSVRSSDGPPGQSPRRQSVRISESPTEQSPRRPVRISESPPELLEARSPSRQGTERIQSPPEGGSEPTRATGTGRSDSRESPRPEQSSQQPSERQPSSEGSDRTSESSPRDAVSDPSLMRPPALKFTVSRSDEDASSDDSPSMVPFRPSSVGLSGLAIGRPTLRATLLPFDENSRFSALENALKEKKIHAKENVKAKDLDMMGAKIDEMKTLLQALEETKADRQAVEELWQFLKTHITDNAMFTGKPLLGFKCLSCEHSIEKLNPFRSDYLPNNIMPKQFLSMLTAERLFSHVDPRLEKRDSSPRRDAPKPPPAAGEEQLRAAPTAAAALNGLSPPSKAEPAVAPKPPVMFPAPIAPKPPVMFPAPIAPKPPVMFPTPIVASFPIRKS